MIGDSLDLGWTSCFGMETSVETSCTGNWISDIGFNGLGSIGCGSMSGGDKGFICCSDDE